MKKFLKEDWLEIIPEAIERLNDLEVELDVEEALTDKEVNDIIFESLGGFLSPFEIIFSKDGKRIKEIRLAV